MERLPDSPRASIGLGLTWPRYQRNPATDDRIPPTATQGSVARKREEIVCDTGPQESGEK